MTKDLELRIIAKTRRCLTHGYYYVVWGGKTFTSKVSTNDLVRIVGAHIRSTGTRGR